MDHVFDELPYEIEEYEKNPKKYLSIWRNRYEPFVFDRLKLRYGKFLDTFWNSYKVPRVSDRAIVIVERRCHPNLAFILRNVAYFCQEWSIYLFCSKANRAFCEEACGVNADTVRIITQFTEVVDGETGVREYNNLLKTAGFWMQIEAETLLTVEMDCYLRHSIPEKYLDYDYIGTPWCWDLESPGGTGLTLRKKSAMMLVCARGDSSIAMQDYFAAEAVKRLGLKWLPSEPDGVFVFSESCYSDNPIGVHQWWTFAFSSVINGEDFDFAEEYCTLDIPL